MQGQKKGILSNLFKVNLKYWLKRWQYQAGVCLMMEETPPKSFKKSILRYQVVVISSSVCKNTWSSLMQIMWYHHAQIIWMKECREDFHYKKNWITSKMMCTFKWVTPQTLPYLHSLEKKKFFCAQAKLWCLSRRQWRPLGEDQPYKWQIWAGFIGPLSSTHPNW